MVNTGLLVLTNPARVTKLLSAIKDHVLKTLYIQYFPEKNLFISRVYPVALGGVKGPRYSQVVANIYSIASSHSNNLDVRVLLSNFKNPNGSIIATKRPVELVIFDQEYNPNEANTFIQDCLSNTSMGCKFITFNEKDQECDKDGSNDTIDEKLYKNVVLGGTFDRLHNGHKIILSNAILRCTEKLTVGVTDTNMLSRKILWEIIEPCSLRINYLKDFVEDVDPTLSYNVVPITDMYGPTKEDPTFELLVVSEETKKGGDMVNQKRLENRLKSLDIHVVPLAKDNDHQEHEDVKISSCNSRMRLLGQRLKPPNVCNKPLKPYIIGLTGGIASGKSSIADKLQKLGAGLINCDIVAHELYAPGKKCYNVIVETFGPEYLTPTGEIDRKALGNLVFNDKNELEKLNKLMWPVILDETKKRITELYKKGFNIVVVEAAVLIQAGWQPNCHEIWTCIIPQDEAIKRLMERNKLSEEEAKKRILVQPSNTEQVNNAHVVVSTLWSHAVTMQQVLKAWNRIMTDLEKSS